MGYCLNTVANFISSNFDFPSAENLSILGDMLPASNEVFNLGSDDMKWKDLYLSGETIYLGKSKITNDASSGISFRNESNNTINLTVSSISIQDPLQQNKKVTIQVDSDENVSNYVLNTSNNISTRLTNIDTNVSNYVVNTSNEISKRITNVVDALDTGLLFETILVEQGIYIPLFIDKLSMKTRISSENLEFVHTFDVSISLDKNSLYHIVLFIVYNEDKSFKEIDYNVMFSYYSIDDIVISDTYIEFKTIDLKIIYLPDNFSFWIRVENDINPKVNIISR